MGEKLQRNSICTKRKPTGREPSLRTPVNIKRVYQAFVRSPRRLASKNAIALRISDGTVHRILHKDLNFHPYKMVMVQAINDDDTVNRKTVRFFIEAIPLCVNTISIYIYVIHNN